VIIIPIKTVSLTNQREHWRVRHRRTRYEREAVSLLMPKGVPIPCTVRLTRISPGILDDDNLRGALKSVRDEIAKLSGVDDADPRIRWEYDQHRAGARRYEVRVEVAAVQRDAI
jgi:hypothetical protein